MRGQHADKIWLAGGAITAAILALLTWLLLVSPRNEATEATRVSAADALDKVRVQQKAIERLEQDSVNLPKYKAELDKIQHAIPPSDDFPDLLRALRQTAEDNDVTVTTLSVAGTGKVKDASPTIYDMPLTMAVEGDSDDVQRFLDDLQQHNDRAVLIDSVNVSAAEGSIDGKVTISLALHVFVSGDGPPAVDGQTAVS